MSDRCNLCKREFEKGDVRFYILSATDDVYVEEADFIGCVCLYCALKILCRARLDDGERLGESKIFQKD